MGRHKGSLHSEEVKKKISDAHKRIGAPWMKGKRNSPSTEFKKGQKFFHKEETKKKISFANKGQKVTEEQRQRLREVNLGKKHSQETKQRMSEAHKGKHVGENNGMWKGGISFEIYPQEFNRELKLKIRQRDNFVCCLCGKTEREELEELNRVLCVNHIDFDKKNCKEKNLNTLCLRCNVRINGDREKWTAHFNDKNGEKNRLETKQIRLFQIGSFGEIYILYEDGSFIQGELEHITGNEEELKVNIIKKIILP